LTYSSKDSGAIDRHWRRVTFHAESANVKINYSKTFISFELKLNGKANSDGAVGGQVISLLMLRARAPSASHLATPAAWGSQSAWSRLFTMLETRRVAAYWNLQNFS
jgi:hypothetical protein